MISSLVFISTLTCVYKIIKFIVMEKRDFAISCNSSDHSSKYSVNQETQIAIIKTEAADCSKINNCVILNILATATGVCGFKSKVVCMFVFHV